MSLLDEAFEKCHYVNKIKVPDGYGGIKDSYSLGTEFSAAIVFNTSIEARIAEKQGVTSLYTVTTRKNVTLEAREIFQRDRDGKIFRVTSDGDDNYTPNSAHLNMRQVTAEEFTLGGSINNE